MTQRMDDARVEAQGWPQAEECARHYDRGRAEALEEAAKIVENCGETWGGPFRVAVAAEIRALKERESARRALRHEARGVRGKVMMEWRPIESAPRDGRWIVGCRQESPRRIQTIIWHAGAGQWLSRGSQYINDLTHWMPLDESEPMTEDTHGWPQAAECARHYDRGKADALEEAARLFEQSPGDEWAARRIRALKERKP